MWTVLTGPSKNLIWKTGHCQCETATLNLKAVLIYSDLFPTLVGLVWCHGWLTVHEHSLTVHELGICVIASFSDLFGFQLLLTIILRNRRVARLNITEAQWKVATPGLLLTSWCHVVKYSDMNLVMKSHSCPYLVTILDPIQTPAQAAFSIVHYTGNIVCRMRWGNRTSADPSRKRVWCPDQNFLIVTHSGTQIRPNNFV